MDDRWRHGRATAALLSFSVFLYLVSCVSAGSVLGERALRELSPGQITNLVTSPDPLKSLNPSDPNSHLSKILIPRAPETDNNTLVKNYIVSTLQALDWHIEEDAFTDTTPYGPKRFTNVIATKDPEAPRKVVVSAHFDSKYFPSYPMNQFLGATDSAVPCALMLDLAEALNPLLDQRKEKADNGLLDDEDIADTTLQLIFFDGEEAFKDWTATDSVYGARHLADMWSSEYIQAGRKRRLRPMDTELSTIEHLILLDLLGFPGPRIKSYFTDTAWLFDSMLSSETRLAQSGAFDPPGGTNAQDGEYQSFFVPRTGNERNMGFIEDDHIPFLHKGVNILHIIANPFPIVWHTLLDNAEALDLETMKRWNMIMRVFMSEYLELEPAESPSVVKKSNGEL